MILQQVRYCTSSGRVAVFRGHGNHRDRAITRSWPKGDQLLAMAVGTEEINLGRVKTSMKTGDKSFRLMCRFPCAALQSNSRIDVRAMDEKTYGSDLQGFAQRVAACNEGRERKVEFFRFMVDKDTVGYIHYEFAQHLKRFPDVFQFQPEELSNDGGLAADRISLVQCLSSAQLRTAAVQGVLEILKTEGLIPGWRNELQPVILTYGAPPFLLMERAAFPLFGAKSYGVHVNGFVNVDGEKYLWVAKRSDTKQTFPGMLDHIVAGGQPEGISAKENVIKECDEEASIPLHLAKKAVAAGAVSYEYVMGKAIKRDVLFCYDLELPHGFEPHNKGRALSICTISVSGGTVAFNNMISLSSAMSDSTGDCDLMSLYRLSSSVDPGALSSYYRWRGSKFFQTSNP